MRATQDSVIPYQTIEEMQQTLFGEVDPITTYQIVCSGFLDYAKVLPDFDEARWGKNISLDTDPRTLVFPIPENNRILEQFKSSKRFGIMIRLKPKEGTEDQGRHDWQRHYNQFLLERAINTNFETSTVLCIEQRRLKNQDTQIAQLPDFVLEALSEKSPSFLEECRRDTACRGNKGRGYGRIPVFNKLAIETPPTYDDGLFWSSLATQIADFKERNFWRELDGGSLPEAFRAWIAHQMSGGRIPVLHNLDIETPPREADFKEGNFWRELNGGSPWKAFQAWIAHQMNGGRMD